MTSSLTGHFIPGEIAPDTHLIGDWVDLRASLDTVKKRTVFQVLRIKSQLSSP
jgi:hypothetical protein